MRKTASVCTLMTAALALVFILSLCLLPQRLAFRGAEEYRFYLGDTSRNCKEVCADGATAPLLRLTLKGVCGESATYSHANLQDVLSEYDAKIVFREELSDSVNYYCTAKLPYSVTLYGREINLHVCIKEEKITVATPIIFGGY